MSIPSSPPSSVSVPSLQAFQEAAARKADVYLDGQQLVLLGSGQTPQGRQVEWVAPTGDAAGALIQALNNEVGNGLGSVIAHELGLNPAPGKPLSARTIERAVEMAHEGRHVLEGVDFMTQLRLSAQSFTPDFVRVCEQAGVNAHTLSTSARKEIDDMLGQRFQEAARTGNVPVSPQESERWLADILAARLTDG